MTARDELVDAMRADLWSHMATSTHNHVTEVSESLIAAGWRKMPSAEQIEAHLEDMEFHWSQPWKGDVLNAILALMDGDNE